MSKFGAWLAINGADLTGNKLCIPSQNLDLGEEFTITEGELLLWLQEQIPEAQLDATAQDIRDLLAGLVGEARLPVGAVAGALTLVLAANRAALPPSGSPFTLYAVADDNGKRSLLLWETDQYVDYTPGGSSSGGETRVTLLTDDQKARMTLRYVGSLAPSFSQSGAKDYSLTVPAGTRLNAWQFHAIEAATVTNGGNFNLAITDEAGNVNTGLYDITDIAGQPINRTAYNIGVDISYTAGTMSLQFTNVGGTGAFKIPFTVCG